MEDKSLNKFISETGFCSRRQADDLIEAGRVMLNGIIAKKGNRATEKDEILIDGKPLPAAPKHVYIMLNKPVGITCTTDTNVKNNVVSFMRYPERIFPVGRLDKPSEGLLLLTNDGEIVNKILRAGNDHEKEYLVAVDKAITKDFLKRMAAGVPILDTVTKPCKIYKEDKNVFRIILTQGLNRQIRRMCEYLGYEVTALRRIRIMNLWLDDLPKGQWRYLTQEEMKVLNKTLKNSSKLTAEQQKLQEKKRKDDDIE